MTKKITIQPLDSGYLVTHRVGPTRDSVTYRTAEATLTGALGIAARALGYTGTIEFGPLTGRAIAVPVVDSVDAYAPPGVPFDAEEPPLRAGTATKPDDLL